MEPRNYKCGDVVWVMAGKRLGWWAGRVENVEELRQDLASYVTDKTIAVVKYLNEENYQFVEDEAIICAYDSERKDEYISIGMKKYFEKKRINETSNSFMKFANNVKQAEQLTGGNPGIIDDEKFQPKKAVPAQSKYKNIFVDPKVKETKTKSPSKGGATSSPRRPGRPPAKEPTTPKLNHPRFQGQSDHEVRIRRQEKSSVTGSPGVGEYKCVNCDFQTTRLNLMVIHKKTEHLKSSNTPTTTTTKQKAAQKRPANSPPKKLASKKSKATEEPEPDGDLFDQIKRNLESKEATDSKPSPKSKTSVKANASSKAAQTKKTPKAPKTPRTPRSAKVIVPSTSAKTPTVKANDTKTQFNPKKKWLKSLQKEANPEVKNKLMADWDEDDEEEKQQQIQQTEVSSTNAERQVEATADSDSDNDTRPTKSGLLHQRSDDEEDDDEAMEIDRPILKSPEKFAEDYEEATNTEESLAGISAEIDKLNADLDATNHETRSSKINGEPESINSLSPKKETGPSAINGVKSPTRDPHPSKREEEIKQDVASLLAETSVPIIPDITELSKVVENEVGKIKSILTDDEEMEQEVENEDIEISVAKRAVEERETDLVVENEVENTISNPSVNKEEKLDQVVENEVAKANPEKAMEKEEVGQLQDNDVKISENLDTSNARIVNQVEEEEKTILCEILSVDKEVTTEALPENGVENGVEVAAENEEETLSLTQNGEATQVVTTNGGSNILMQVEGGETYMVVWEPGSNIQEFLECGGEGEDGSTGATQTLLIDPSSLQAGSDLENLFQMAVAASAVSQPQQNEQSNSTTSITSKDGERSTKSTPKGTPNKGNKSKVVEELIKKHGDALNKELQPDTLVWYKNTAKNTRLFLPGAVIESSDPKFITLVAFDIERPNNQRKYQRNLVIAAFHHELNLELLTFGRTKHNKATDRQKLSIQFDHASSFFELRSKPNFTQLTARQYLSSCHRSPVKLFSERYLTSSPLDDIMDAPSLTDDFSSGDSAEEEDDEEKLKRSGEIAKMMLDKHVLTDACILHLADFVNSPSEEWTFKLNLYESKSWNQLTRFATTSGILGNSRELYSKVADFLNENVHRVRKLEEFKDNKRVFVLDLLLPEALAYGVQRTFHVTYEEAKKMLVCGIKDNKVPVNT